MRATPAGFKAGGMRPEFRGATIASDARLPAAREVAVPRALLQEVLERIGRLCPAPG